MNEGICLLLASQATDHPRLWASCPLWSLGITDWAAPLLGFPLPSWHSTHLQLVLMFFVDAGKQLGFPSVEGVDEGITLGHQAGLKLHTVLLCEEAHLSAMRRPGALGLPERTELPNPSEGWRPLLTGMESNSVHEAHQASSK